VLQIFRRARATGLAIRERAEFTIGQLVADADSAAVAGDINDNSNTKLKSLECKGSVFFYIGVESRIVLERRCCVHFFFQTPASL
jgi:hypothetical protein